MLQNLFLASPFCFVEIYRGSYVFYLALFILFYSPDLLHSFFFFLSKAERSGSSPFMATSVEARERWNVRAPVKRDITTFPRWNQGAPCVRSHS